MQARIYDRVEASFDALVRATTLAYHGDLCVMDAMCQRLQKLASMAVCELTGAELTQARRGAMKDAEARLQERWTSQGERR